MKAKVIIAIVAICVLIAAGTPVIAGSEVEGYTKHDMKFFVWVEDTTKTLYNHYESADRSTSGLICEFRYKEVIAEIRIAEAQLKRMKTSNNLNSAKAAIANFLAGVKEAALIRAEYVLTDDIETYRKAEDILERACTQLDVYRREIDQVLLVGPQEEEEKQEFRISPGEAIGISLELDEVQDFVRSAELTAQFGVYLVPDHRGRCVWQVVWTLDNLWSVTPDGITMEIDVETGEVVDEPVIVRRGP